MKRLVLLVLVASCDNTPEVPPPAPIKAPVAAAPASQPVTAVTQPVKVDSGPRVLALEGPVTIDGAAAYEGMPVAPTATVETGDKAWARLTLMTGSVLQVRPNTKFTLGSSVRKKWSLKLALGAVWSFLPKGASYEVETSNAVAGVRGTTLFVGQLGPDQSGVCACDGEVELGVGAKNKRVKSKHEHIGTMIGGAGKKAKMGKQVKAKEPPGHNDVEGAQLEKVRDSLKQ